MNSSYLTVNYDERLLWEIKDRELLHTMSQKIQEVTCMCGLVASLWLLCFFQVSYAWTEGPSHLHTGQLSMAQNTKEAYFNVTVASPCLDFAWKILTQEKEVSVFVLEEVFINYC